MSKNESHVRGRLQNGITEQSKRKWKLAACALRSCIAAAIIVYIGGIAGSLWRPASTAAGAGSDADALARDVIRNEVRAQIQDNSLWHYHEVEEEARKSKTLDVFQTKDGEIDRLVALNNEPLNTRQAQAEDQRIQKLVTHPDQMREEEKKRHDDAVQERNMLKMFPDAFRFQFTGEQKDDVIKLKFTPNPNFRPSGHAEQVFHHMEGTLEVDTKQKRMAEISGRLTSEVRFFGGLFGHLDKGGTFAVKQQDMGSGIWEMTSMNVQMDGKALFFKTIAVRQKETCSDFKRVPDGTTLQQAAELLRKEGGVHIAASK